MLIKIKKNEKIFYRLSKSNEVGVNFKDDYQVNIDSYCLYGKFSKNSDKLTKRPWESVARFVNRALKTGLQEARRIDLAARGETNIPKIRVDLRKS